MLHLTSIRGMCTILSATDKQRSSCFEAFTEIISGYMGLMDLACVQGVYFILYACNWSSMLNFHVDLSLNKKQLKNIMGHSVYIKQIHYGGILLQLTVTCVVTYYNLIL